MKKYDFDTNLNLLEIDPQIIAKLTEKNIFTVGDLLHYSPTELKKISDLNGSQITTIKQIIAKYGLVFANNPIYNYQLQEYILNKLEVDEINLIKLDNNLRYRLLDLKMWAFISLVPKFMQEKIQKINPSLTLKEMINSDESEFIELKDYLHSLGYKFRNEKGFPLFMANLYKSYLNTNGNFDDFTNLDLPPKITKNELLIKYFDLTKKLVELQNKKRTLMTTLDRENESIITLENTINLLIQEMETLRIGYDLR